MVATTAVLFKFSLSVLGLMNMYTYVHVYVYMYARCGGSRHSFHRGSLLSVFTRIGVRRTTLLGKGGGERCRVEKRRGVRGGGSIAVFQNAHTYARLFACECIYTYVQTIEIYRANHVSFSSPRELGGHLLFSYVTDNTVMIHIYTHYALARCVSYFIFSSFSASPMSFPPCPSFMSPEFGAISCS